MHTKIFFLFFLVMFGAYAEYQSNEMLKRLKSREKRIANPDCIFGTSPFRDQTKAFQDSVVFMPKK